MKYLNKYKTHIRREREICGRHCTEYLNQSGEWVVFSQEILYFDNVVDALYLRHEEELFEKTETIQLIKHDKIIWNLGYSE